MTKAKFNNSKLHPVFNCHASKLPELQSKQSGIHNSVKLLTPLSREEFLLSHNLTSRLPPRVSFQSIPVTHTSKIANCTTFFTENREKSYQKKIFSGRTWISFHKVSLNKGAIMKTIRALTLQDDEYRCCEVRPCGNSLWREMHVKSGCLWDFERVTLRYPSKLRSSNPCIDRSWELGIYSIVSVCILAYMH